VLQVENGFAIKKIVSREEVIEPVQVLLQAGDFEPVKIILSGRDGPRIEKLCQVGKNQRKLVIQPRDFGQILVGFWDLDLYLQLGGVARRYFPLDTRRRTMLGFERYFILETVE